MAAALPPAAANLALDERVATLRAAGVDVLHLGFGESRLPVHPLLVEALHRGAGSNSYGPVAGRPELLDAVGGYFERRGLPTEAGQVVVGPGSKPLLLAVMAALGGSVVLPRPSWLTYAAQAQVLGLGVEWVDSPAGFGGVPDPVQLDDLLQRAVGSPSAPRSLLLTSPDNPTGTTAPSELVRQVVEVAARHDLVVISDEIYSDVVHSPAAGWMSPASVDEARTVVLTGLSKSLSLGGWRVGAARFPGTAAGRVLREQVVSFASQSWSNLAAPMQEVGVVAFSEPDDLVSYRERCTWLHGVVARAVHDVLVERGVECPAPTGGFYAYPDFAPMAEHLAAMDVCSSAELERYLLEQHGVATLGAHRFGVPPEVLRLRLATSMLYGESRKDQERALAADDPCGLPQVAAALDRLGRTVDALS
jgi:aspartate aminotransferase